MRKLARSRSGEPVMPWGKYKGRPFSRLPYGYVVWLSQKIGVEDEWRGVRFAAWDELERRKWKKGSQILPGSYESGKRR